MQRLWQRPDRRHTASQDATTGRDAHARHAINQTTRRLRAHAMEDANRADIIRIGLKDSIWADFYHHALTISWRGFLLWAALLYVALNLVFALLYALVPGQITAPHPVHLLDLFFFSVQTFSTVGYGLMAPSGRAANAIASLELLVGMMVNALATGAMFARIARPRARILFAERAVVSQETGISALCIRIANCRKSMILSVDIEVALSRLIVSPSGHLVRQFDPLLLVQSHVPVLRFTFTTAHVITEPSALSGLSLETLQQEQAEIIMTVTGTDEATGQTIFARTAYGFDRVMDHHRFVDMIDSRPDGRLAVDYSRFHDTEPHPEPGAKAGITPELPA